MTIILTMCAGVAEAKPPSASQDAEFAELRAEVDALWAAMPTAGHVFTRWGSAEALPDTTVVTTGHGFASGVNADEAGVGEMMLIPNQDPDAFLGTQGRHLSPVVLMAGIYELGSRPENPDGQDRPPYLAGATLYSERVTATVWDTQSAPAGWEVLYTGMAYGGWAHAPLRLDPICVDYAAATYRAPAADYPTGVVWVGPVYQAVDGLRRTECAVIRKL
ncbi:MAG: hypothetical protein KC912_14775 [Proteobacteria bacterium]|nr:hypothetical protein [Pseudomonadota bacterium]